MATRPWQDIAKERETHRNEAVNQLQPPLPHVPHDLPVNVTKLPLSLLSAQEVRITETPTEDLLAALASAKLTSVEVTNAFLRRAGLAQKLVCRVDR